MACISHIYIYIYIDDVVPPSLQNLRQTPRLLNLSTLMLQPRVAEVRRFGAHCCDKLPTSMFRTCPFRLTLGVVRILGIESYVCRTNQTPMNLAENLLVAQVSRCTTPDQEMVKAKVDLSRVHWQQTFVGYIMLASTRHKMSKH